MTIVLVLVILALAGAAAWWVASTTTVDDGLPKDPPGTITDTDGHKYVAIGAIGALPPGTKPYVAGSGTNVGQVIVRTR